MINVKYLDNNIQLPDGTDVEEAREKLARLYSEVKHAQAFQDDDGNITFKVASGDKGSDMVKVVFGDVSVNLPEGTSVEEARSKLGEIYSEIRNADGTYDEDENVIRFRLTAGDKGR